MIATTECEFFISEAEATKIVRENMKDIMSRIDASSSLNASSSAADSTGGGSGGAPCNGSPGNGLSSDDPNFVDSCQCCVC